MRVTVELCVTPSPRPTRHRPDRVDIRGERLRWTHAGWTVCVDEQQQGTNKRAFL